MKEYFLTEEQYCDNAFVTNIVPLTLRFRAKNTFCLSDSSEANGKAPNRNGNQPYIMVIS
ncbi:hypothetical protein [Lysinibacillus xylanilyticus]|uniref:hypothetical protein n=1 Tax=Lysinibacillus xylanilyticus TaxID=582475 RepID=UPI003816FAC7